MSNVVGTSQNNIDTRLKFLSYLCMESEGIAFDSQEPKFDAMIVDKLLPQTQIKDVKVEEQEIEVDLVDGNATETEQLVGDGPSMQEIEVAVEDGNVTVTEHFSGGDNVQFEQNQSYRVIYSDQLPRLPRLHFGRIENKGKSKVKGGGWSALQRYASYLSDRNRSQAYRYPQLGNFLILNTTGTFKNTMYHQLMIRMMERPAKHNLYELWFLINEKPTRFSAVELALITGLRFTHEVSESEEAKLNASTLKSKYFPNMGANKVTLKQVEAQVIDIVRRSKETIDRLKLVFVLILSNFLLYTRSGYVDDYIFQVCDNLSICDKYDWGKRCWDISYKDIVNRIDKHLSSKAESWDTVGCPWFILFWMLEAIQGTDKKLQSTLLPNSSNVYPRMLRWCLESLSLNSKQSSDFLDKVKVVIPQLMPDATEESMPYMRGIRKFMKDFNAPAGRYKRLRKDLRKVEVHDRLDPKHDNTIENFPVHDNTVENFPVHDNTVENSPEHDNMATDAPTTSKGPSTSNVEDFHSWNVQFDQRFQTLEQKVQAIEDRIAADAALAEQRHAEVMKMQVVETLLAQQRHAEIMQAIQQNARDLSEQRQAEIMQAIQQNSRAGT